MAGEVAFGMELWMYEHLIHGFDERVYGIIAFTYSSGLDLYRFSLKQGLV